MTKFIKENWFKFSVLLLVAIAVFLSLFYIVSFAQKQKTINQTTKCANSAAKVFEQLIKERGNYAIDAGNSYINHWNNNLDKCFILFSSNKTQNNGSYLLTYKSLVDVFELKTYGSFEQSSEREKPYLCYMTNDGNDKASKTCGTETEFDNYANTFMNN